MEKAYLEKRVSDLEQYTKINDILVMGGQTNPGHAYIAAVTNGGVFIFLLVVVKSLNI